MNDLPENYEDILGQTLIDLGCQPDTVEGESWNAVKAQWIDPDVTVYLSVSPDGQAIRFTASVWRLGEDQQRFVEQLDPYLKSDFDHGLRAAKAALRKLLDSF